MKFHDDTLASQMKDQDGCAKMTPVASEFYATEENADVESQMIP